MGDSVRVGFTGHEDDVEFGLINLGGRIYDPQTTRFLTPDPIGRSLGASAGNRYAYVLNNPTNLVDPSGFAEEVGLDAFGPGSGLEFGLTPEYSRMVTRTIDGFPTNNIQFGDEWYAQPEDVVLVKPATVMAWHRRGYHRYWTWKWGKPGRPGIPAEHVALSGA